MSDEGVTIKVIRVIPIHFDFLLYVFTLLDIQSKQLYFFYMITGSYDRSKFEASSNARTVDGATDEKHRSDRTASSVIYFGRNTCGRNILFRYGILVAMQ